MNNIDIVELDNGRFAVRRTCKILGVFTHSYFVSWYYGFGSLDALSSRPGYFYSVTSLAKAESLKCNYIDFLETQAFENQMRIKRVIPERNYE